LQLALADPRKRREAERGGRSANKSTAIRRIFIRNVEFSYSGGVKVEERGKGKRGEKKRIA